MTRISEATQVNLQAGDLVPVARPGDNRALAADVSSAISNAIDAVTPASIGAATSAQGALADTATQPDDVLDSISLLGNIGLFGDGSDGSVTSEAEFITKFSPVANVATLTRDTSFFDLLIPAGYTIKNDGFNIYCNGTLQNDGIITNAGTDGTNGSNGSTSYGTPGLSGGTGSHGAVTLGGVGGGGGTTIGTNGSTGSGSTQAMIGAMGGSAGAPGGAGTSGSGGTGGTATTVSFYSAVYGNLRWFFPLVTGRIGQSQAIKWHSGPSGSGGGGGDGSARGGAAGGIGGSGGWLVLVAKRIINNGLIDVSGGNGGNGGNGANANCGGGGGANGGSGGVLVTAALTRLGSGIYDITGGLGGNGGTGFVNGQNGNSGNSGIQINLGA